MPSIAIDQALNLPAEHVGQALLDAREDQWFDRKSARIKARQLADVLIGFANADGGIVAVGLGAGRVEGIGSIGGAINELQQTAIDFTVPQVAATTRLIPCVRGDGEPDELLIFDVRPAPTSSTRTLATRYTCASATKRGGSPSRSAKSCSSTAVTTATRRGFWMSARPTWIHRSSRRTWKPPEPAAQRVCYKRAVWQRRVE